MNKDNDFTCKKWGIVIDSNFKKKLKKYKCTLCNDCGFTMFRKPAKRLSQGFKRKRALTRRIAQGLV